MFPMGRHASLMLSMAKRSTQVEQSLCWPVQLVVIHTLVERVIYTRREARIDLCDFLLQNTTEFF